MYGGMIFNVFLFSYFFGFLLNQYLRLSYDVLHVGVKGQMRIECVSKRKFERTLKYVCASNMLPKPTFCLVTICLTYKSYSKDIMLKMFDLPFCV